MMTCASDTGTSTRYGRKPDARSFANILAFLFLLPVSCTSSVMIDTGCKSTTVSTCTLSLQQLLIFWIKDQSEGSMSKQKNILVVVLVVGFAVWNQTYMLRDVNNCIRSDYTSYRPTNDKSKVYAQ